MMKHVNYSGINVKGIIELENEAVILATKVTDTIKIVDKRGFIKNTR